MHNCHTGIIIDLSDRMICVECDRNMETDFFVICRRCGYTDTVYMGPDGFTCKKCDDPLRLAKELEEYKKKAPR